MDSYLFHLKIRSEIWLITNDLRKGKLWFQNKGKQFGLVSFFNSISTSVGYLMQSHPCRRTAMILFDPWLEKENESNESMQQLNTHKNLQTLQVHILYTIKSKYLRLFRLLLDNTMGPKELSALNRALSSCGQWEEVKTRRNYLPCFRLHKYRARHIFIKKQTRWWLTYVTRIVHMYFNYLYSTIITDLPLLNFKFLIFPYLMNRARQSSINKNMWLKLKLFYT